jgi:glycerol dehydrogenase-like iron-containing ADH family enzyme
MEVQVLAAAPRRFLVSGIGDALSKLYEGQQVTASSAQLSSAQLRSSSRPLVI